MLSVFLAPLLGALAFAQNTSSAAGSSGSQPTPVSTAVPSATGSLSDPVPGQGSYPPLQSKQPQHIRL